MSLSSDRACVVVLDDLHWADRDTLALLGSVSLAAPQGQLLIVATCREPDLAIERDGPLADALADLVIHGAWRRLRLSGLDESGVGTYLAAGLDGELSSALVRTVHDATEGTPFYVREVMRHLVEEGGRPGGRPARESRSRQGRSPAPSPSRMAVPDTPCLSFVPNICSRCRPAGAQP